MEFHEVANIFPLLEGPEYEFLVNDIRHNGLIESIWTHEGKIVDGRNRYRACRDADVDPRFREWNGDGSLVSFVVSLNLKRRHLNASQRAMIGVEIEEALEKEAHEYKIAHLKKGTEMPAVENLPQREPGKSRDHAGRLVGVSGRLVSEAKAIQTKSPEMAQRVRAGEMTLHAAKLTVQKEEARELSKSLVLPEGKYRTIVIDPPWPTEKIPLKTRPHDIGFEYPTMTPQELMDFPAGDFAHDDCHLYLWTTHKHLPLAFRIIDHWGFRYQCLMTWVKNVGFTPFSWMYSTEHVLFCRRGNLELLQRGLRLDFSAKARQHSRKPNEFYELVKQASPDPRIDLFSREEREGFVSWGNETGKFNEEKSDPQAAAAS